MKRAFVVAAVVVVTGLGSGPWVAAGPKGRRRQPIDPETADVLALVGPVVAALGATNARSEDAPRRLTEALRTGRTDTAAWASIVRWVLVEREEKVAAGLAAALPAVPPPASGPDAARWNATAAAIVGTFASVLRDAQTHTRRDGDAIVSGLVSAAAPAIAAALAESDPAARESALGPAALALIQRE